MCVYKYHTFCYFSIEHFWMLCSILFHGFEHIYNSASVLFTLPCWPWPFGHLPAELQLYPTASYSSWEKALVCQQKLLASRATVSFAFSLSFVIVLLFSLNIKPVFNIRLLFRLLSSLFYFPPLFIDALVHLSYLSTLHFYPDVKVPQVLHLIISIHSSC